MTNSPPTVAIVGAGASGVLTALHLLDRLGADALRVLLVERSRQWGAGVAFSSPSKSHLLNVPASSMSAFGHDPDHFVCWLAREGHAAASAASAAFVPRYLYGRYLRETLRSRAQEAGGDLLSVVRDEVVTIGTAEGLPRLGFSSGRYLYADAVVLATGLVPPKWPAALQGCGADDRCIADPWLPGALGRIEPTATVTLLGTGLTAVDAALALADRGQIGPVHAISRHGLLPMPHSATPLWTTGQVAVPVQELEGTTVRALLNGFRRVVADAQATGADWREAVDALRPRAPSLWQALDETEQRRFKRHVERVWSVHRHRMAPAVARRVESLCEAGTFHVHPGEILSVEPGATSLAIEVRLRGAGRSRRWRTDWLVNCTGPGSDNFGADQALASSLRASGLAQPGRLGLGIATSAEGQVLGAGGRPVPWLWAVGCLRQGQLFESSAVPEIRAQALEVSAALRRRLVAGRATREPPALVLSL